MGHVHSQQSLVEQPSHRHRDARGEAQLFNFYELVDAKKTEIREEPVYMYRSNIGHLVISIFLWVKTVFISFPSIFQSSGRVLKLVLLLYRMQLLVYTNSCIFRAFNSLN